MSKFKLIVYSIIYVFDDEPTAGFHKMVGAIQDGFVVRELGPNQAVTKRKGNQCLHSRSRTAGVREPGQIGQVESQKALWDRLVGI